MAFNFLRPLVSGSHVFELLPEEYRVAYFREMTPGMVSVFSTLLGSKSGYMFGISLRGFLGRISRFPTCREDFRTLRSIITAENCGVSAVAVHRRRRHLCHRAQADSHGR